jgi:hypothetical protein
MPSDATILDTKRGAKGGKKRRKRRPQWVTVVAFTDDDNDKNVDDSRMGCLETTAHSGKRQVRPLIDHFERLLELACPNHAYPIKDKLRYYNMMKSFMTSGSQARDIELEEDTDRSDPTPFLEEDAVYDGCTPPRRHHMSNLSPGTPTCYGWGHEDIGM